MRGVIAFLSVLLSFGGIGNTVQAQNTAGIILLETMPVPVVKEHSTFFLAYIGEQGYLPTGKLDVKVLECQGDKEKGRDVLTQALAEEQAQVVVSNATLASQVASEVLKDTGIPLVFMTVSDPVGAGLISAVGKPTGTFITGKVHMIPRETKIDIALRLAKNLAKTHTVKVGFIHSSYPSSRGDLRELMKVAARGKNIEFVPYQIPYEKGPQGMQGMLTACKGAAKELSSQVDFWWEPSGPLGEVKEYTVALMENSNKPIIMGNTIESTRLGAIIAFTPSPKGTAQEVALIVKAILHGKSPGDIPPAPPATFQIGINLHTAIEHGIVIPSDLMSLAGKNIFR